MMIRFLLPVLFAGLFKLNLQDKNPHNDFEPKEMFFQYIFNLINTIE